MSVPATPPGSPRPTTRPRIHFTAKEGWINDPLGLTYHDGLYHLFFQYVPGQVTWSPRCQWGHAVSNDLLAWTEREVILKPGDGDGGCWSGSVAVNVQGQPTLFYTSVQLDNLNVGQVRVAHPTDNTWNQWHKGPVIADIVPPAGTTVFRDPHVTRDGDLWRMLLGGGTRDGTATALSYSSADLTRWTADGEFASRPGSARQPLWTGTVWECPQLVSFGERCALLFSVWEAWTTHYEAYVIGRMIAQEFVPETWGRLSYGDAYYAGATFVDDENQTGLIYWLRGIDDIQGRWAGAHSLPHRIRLDADVLIAEPHPNIARQRRRALSIGQQRESVEEVLPPLADIEWKPDLDRSAALALRSADGTKVVRMAVVDGKLLFETDAKSWTMPCCPHVRVIIDGPVVEVFTRDGTFSTFAGSTDLHAISVTDSACAIYEL